MNVSLSHWIMYHCKYLWNKGRLNSFRWSEAVITVIQLFWAWISKTSRPTPGGIIEGLRHLLLRLHLYLSWASFHLLRRVKANRNVKIVFAQPQLFDINSQVERKAFGSLPLRKAIAKAGNYAALVDTDWRRIITTVSTCLIADIPRAVMKIPRTW